MAAPTPVPPPAPRRSSRKGQGTGGRDVQLNQLSDVLVAPTRQRKRRFVPDNPGSLPVNPRAPVQKNKRRKASVRSSAVGAPPPQTLSLLQPLLPPPSSQPLPPPLLQPLPPPSLQPIPPPSLQLQPQPRPQQLHSLTQPVTNSRFGFFPPPSPQPLSSTPRSLRSSPTPPPVSPRHIDLPVDAAPTSLQDLSDTESSPDEGEDKDDYKEIDEISDGEDERRAHDLLQATPAQARTMGGSSLISLPYNNHDFAELSSDQPVLQQHYTRNRTPKAPAPVPLQRSSAHISPSAPSQPPSDGRLTLDTYPPFWREVITNAKKTFRAYLAGRNGFPNPAEAVDEARECLEDALAVLQEERRTVDATCSISRDMAMLVYAESWGFRSQLKADIRVQVRNLKILFPDGFKGGAEEYQAHIRKTVSAWVEDGSYLHGTVANSDDQIHFAHPIIESTCKAFYFDKWAKVSMLDQDTFRGSVPKPLIALVGTIYRNVLDEWNSGVPKTVKLECDDYGEVYDAILNALETVGKHKIDGPLLHQRLASWAGFGASMNSSLAAPRISTPIYLRLSAA